MSSAHISTPFFFPIMHLRAIFGFIAVLFLPAVTLCAGELPPDSAYVQLDEKGHFALDNRRLRFWGAQGGFPFSSDVKNMALVERLKATGFNMVRLFEIIPAKYKKGDQSLQDRTDFFLAELKRQGFHVWMSSLYRGNATPEDVSIINDPTTAADWQAGIREWQAKRQGKPVPTHGSLARIWDPRLEALSIQYMKSVGNHVNQYTGLRYADDPVFAIWELTNEEWWFGKMVSGSWQTLPAFFQESLLRQWSAFLQTKYGGNKALTQAWGFLLPGEDIASSTVQLAPLRDTSKPVVLNDAGPAAQAALKGVSGGLTRDQFKAQRGSDVIEFLLKIWIDHKKRLDASVKSLGKSTQFAPIVWDTGIGYEIQAQYMQQHAGAIAHCSYITGFQVDPKDELFPWASGLAETPRMCSGVPWLEHNRLAGKPFLVYENQIEQPAKYRAEYPLRIATLGAIQDWDAINWHYFGHEVDLKQEHPYDRALDVSQSSPGTHPQGYHFQFDESQMAAMRTAAELFKNGALPPAPAPTEFVFGRPALLDPASMDYGASYGEPGLKMLPTTYRYGVRLKIDAEQKEYVKITGPTLSPRLGEPNPIRPNEAIEYDWRRGHLKADAPAGVAYAGFFARHGGPVVFSNGLTLDQVSITNPPNTPYPVSEDEQYIAFALSSSTGEPLGITKTATLSLVSSSFNTGFALDTSKLTEGFGWQRNPGAIVSLGTAPVLVCRVGATLKGPALRGFRYRFLDWHFREIAAGVIEEDTLVLPADLPVFLTELSR